MNDCRSDKVFSHAENARHVAACCRLSTLDEHQLTMVRPSITRPRPDETSHTPQDSRSRDLFAISAEIAATGETREEIAPRIVADSQISDPRFRHHMGAPAILRKNSSCSRKFLYSVVRFIVLLVLTQHVVAEVDFDEGAANQSLRDDPSNPLSSSSLTPSELSDPNQDQARKQYWKRTFDEIRDLRYNQTSRNVLTNQWKEYFLDRGSATRKRFDGFVSWERLLQDWADDIQDYLQKEQEQDYPFSTYGMPMNTEGRVSSSSSGAESSTTADANALPTQHETISPARQKLSALPIPKPAKQGEAVLPHTDLTDKSKHIWIVTTASLPWKTGTAVNPLLRAAYLCQGRKQAGGSVTLHLPWLEREKDQETVYGASSMFASPQEQEDYVRTWLRESAGMPEAAEELSIEWYTAWQNKIENSIYSMGDITALIPDDRVDICILEEPEHLNWSVLFGDCCSVLDFERVLTNKCFFSFAFSQVPSSG